MRTVLPERGRSWPQLRDEMQILRGRDVDWRAGRASVYVFHSGDDALQVAHDAYGAFISENALGPGAFPSLKRMESDVVDIGLELQHAPEGAAGSMTSGGTESILLAMKTCRDWSRLNRPVRGTPRVVVPRTAHPAFDKAAHYLGMEVVRVPVANAQFVADTAAMAAAIDENTVMLVGSAPCFPFGVTDPIGELGQIALTRNVWLHVDACVGGYVAPFVHMLGELVPDYDFRVPGVMSLSADLHKYGYAAKGASTVFYRDKALKEFQGFHFDDWPCGHMYTPTVAGTRPGGAIAAAWAVLNYLGVEGYCERAQAIVDTRRRVADAVRAMGLSVFGDPRLSPITFGGGDLDILAVGDALFRAGWVSSRTNAPPGIHLMISPAHAQSIDEYLGVLRGLVERARRGELAKGATDIRYG